MKNRNDFISTPTIRTNEVGGQGHINDTPAAQEKGIVGFSCVWKKSGKSIRVNVNDGGIWRGPYILSESDVEKYHVA